MKELNLILFISTLPFVALTQHVKIYHGAKNVIANTIDNTIRIDKGGEIVFEVSNPNPLLYKYEFISDDIKEENYNNEFTEVIAYVSFIQHLGKTTEASSSGLLANQALNRLWTNRDQRLTVAKKQKNTQAQIDALTEEKALIDTLRDLAYQIELGQEIFAHIERWIKESDKPKSYQAIMDRHEDTEFFTIINGELSQTFTSIFRKVDEIEFALEEATNAIQKESASAYLPLYEILKAQAEKMLADFKVIQEKYSVFAFSYTTICRVPVNKKKVVRLKVTPLHEKYKGRIVGDSLLTFTLIPYYDRKRIELIPMGTLAFTPQKKDFFLESGVIAMDEGFGSNLMPGTMLNINLKNFGEERENSFGWTLGIGLDDGGKNLLNFSSGPLLSHRNIIRFGIGGGFAQFPKGVNGSAVGQPLPANVSNLEDVIEFDEQFALFLNLSFFGFNIKL